MGGENLLQEEGQDSEPRAVCTEENTIRPACSAVGEGETEGQGKEKMRATADCTPRHAVAEKSVRPAGWGGGCYLKRTGKSDHYMTGGGDRRLYKQRDRG